MKLLIQTIIFSLFLFATTSAVADVIEINVKTKAEPKAALGIFFSTGKLAQQPNTTFERIDDETIVVQIPFELRNLPSATPFATAYVITEDDQIVFGNIRMVSLSDSRDSFLRMKTCDDKISNPKLAIPVSEQINYLESLRDIRVKKRQVLKDLLKEKLSPESVEVINKLEQKLGLTYSQPFGPELDAIEIIERLSRVKETVNLYRSTKKEGLNH